MSKYFAKMLPNKPIKLDDKLRKMFLCSKNIQVGDNFHYITPDNKTLGQTATEDTIEALKTLTLSYWKVIGEISPEATWVKEGDEFVEEQVHRCFIHGSISDLSNPLIRKVKLKGPCGHFH